jgi:enoyl-CoA hydratase/carnithine racemase
MATGAIGEPFYRHWIRALNCLEDMPKVSLAVLHGYSIGGGLQLALGCDARLAASDAVLGLGASRHGIIPDGAVLRLARVVGLGRAKELALFNEDVAPAAALAMGLINWMCPPAELEATLARLLERLRHQAPTANAHIKRLLHESFHRDPRAAIEDVLAAQRDCMESWETAEANRAWQDKREPVYQPRPPRA